MALLQDIIAQATSPNADVTTLLRMCMVLGARLPHEDLARWARQELEGYSHDVKPPAYRDMDTTAKGYFRIPGFTPGEMDISGNVLPEAMRERWTRYAYREPIAECVALLKGDIKKGRFQVPWPVELAHMYGSKFVTNGMCEKAWLEVAPAGIVGIVDVVKTKVLAFALEIEAADPTAGNIAGVPPAIEPAQLDRIFHTTITGGTFHNLALGSLVESQSVLALTADVKVGDLGSLHEALSSLGIGNADVAVLDKSIEEDREEGSSIGTRVKAWLGDLALKAATKSAESGAALAGSAATKYVLAYFGIA